MVATYSGDSNYSTSTASTAEVVTGAPTVTVTPAPPRFRSAAPGANGSTMITFTGVNGYSGTIPLSPALCAGMPSETTCSFSASSAVLNSTTTSAQVMVTFQTTAASSGLPQFVRHPATFDWWSFGGILALACALGALILSARQRCRQPPPLEHGVRNSRDRVIGCDRLMRRGRHRRKRPHESGNPGRRRSERGDYVQRRGRHTQPDAESFDQRRVTNNRKRQRPAANDKFCVARACPRRTAEGAQRAGTASYLRVLRFCLYRRIAPRGDSP